MLKPKVTSREIVEGIMFTAQDVSDEEFEKLFWNKVEEIRRSLPQKNPAPVLVPPAQ